MKLIREDMGFCFFPDKELGRTQVSISAGKLDYGNKR